MSHSRKFEEQLILSFSKAAIGTEIHIEWNDSYETVPCSLPLFLPRVVRHFVVCCNLEKQPAKTAKISHFDPI
ncbi:hypothetical protein M9Y10_042942 [Tritrichomonas musculus]|uniref:Uncharacterized protein n=1 Tax=Tritrichomonas musculus TaxID=1915356 RepID=A0ABR2JYY5_9EUKA